MSTPDRIVVDDVHSECIEIVDVELADPVEHEMHDRSMLCWALAPLIAVASIVFLFLSLWSLLSLIPLLLVAVPAAFIYFRSKRQENDDEFYVHEETDRRLELGSEGEPDQNAPANAQHAA